MFIEPSVAAGGLARLDDLLGLDHLEVEQPQRARMVQAVTDVQGLTSHRQRKEAHGSSSKTSITE